MEIQINRFDEAAKIRQQFARHGISVTEWALRHNFSPALVHAVLANKRKCLRGESHRIAVKLGLKAAPIEPLPAWADEPFETVTRTG